MGGHNDFLKQQYNVSTLLNARVQLHARYSTNKYGWYSWVFDQFNVPETVKILEAGCGTGELWLHNKERIPKDWEITLTDFSDGMMSSTKQQLSSVDHPFRFTVADAIHLPFADQTFDTVIANHMLYHLDDPAIALQEFWRVLKPSGKLYCSTNGLQHLHQLEIWKKLLFPGPPKLPEHARFSLENAAHQLQQYFPSVHLLHYPDALEVSQVEPILDYLKSWNGNIVTDPEKWEQIHKLLQQELASHSTIHITKQTGMFIAGSNNHIAFNKESSML